MREYPPLTTEQIAAIPTLVDCGCRARVHGDGCGVEIDYCRMHAAASELARACRLLAYTEREDGGRCSYCNTQHTADSGCPVAVARKALREIGED